MNLKAGLIFSAISLSILPLASPASAAAPPASSLSETLYDGLRASRIIDSHVFSRQAEYLGRVHNLSLRDDGRIEAVILERERFGDRGDAVFRIPWDRIAQPIHPGVLIADVADTHAPELGLFPEPMAEGKDFLVSEVLGEYALLQAGQGYGYVKDAVFDPSGKLLAILVARDIKAGGGTFAFAYPGRTGKWSPDMSYYGLPFVTAEQATKEGLRVEPEKFTAQGT